MALPRALLLPELLPLLHNYEHQGLVSSLLSGDHLRLKLSDEDFLSPLLPRRARRQIVSSPYVRPGYHKGRTSLTTADKNFNVNIDVQQFSPEEITVKTINDNTIVVECKHKEKPDEHGYISRHFVRSYKVPKGHDITKCVSKLSSDGVLMVTVPKVEKNKKTEVEIPVTFTNLPSQIQNTNDTISHDEVGQRMEHE